MNIQTTTSRKQGFSLVELLLTLVLILCLAAASVFTFTAIYKSANLDEGSDRFQSLIRFAQAEAATTGRKVRLQFVPNESASLESAAELRTIKVTWEADLLNSPGVFEEYTNKAWSEEIVNELVGVTKVAQISESGEPMPVESTETGSTAMEEYSESQGFPAITFYPDGTCDSAEVVLASRNSDDERRLAVRLGGMLGTMTTRTVSGTDVETLDADAADFEEFDELYEMGSPVDMSSAEPAASYAE
ncbi:MAG: GspH/FimT family pseudopilin [Limisphaerales bacterium]